MGKETALPKNIRQIGDVRGKEKIYLEDYVMTYIRKKENEKEYLGLFLGTRQQTGEDTCTFIRGIVEVPKDLQEENEDQRKQRNCKERVQEESEDQRKQRDCKERAQEESEDQRKQRDCKERMQEENEGLRKQQSYEEDTQERRENKTELQQQRKELLLETCRKYFPDLEVQGCCVIGTYQTDRMDQLAQTIPEATNLLYHLQEQEETLYVTGNGQYERIKGYFVFYEQNRNMQEYLAELFQENSVEKESLPDRAIRSFREKVKEKSLQKHTGMMKLASSFFVVAVLAVGAIAVNRVEEIRAIRNQGGDLTAENESGQESVKTVVSGAANSAADALQNTAEEEQRLVNGALMQVSDQAATQSTDSASQAAAQITDSASQAAVQESVSTSSAQEDQTLTWQAGSTLNGPDSFWEEDLEVSGQADNQTDAEASSQSTETSAESGSQAGAEANSQASAEASSQGTEASAESGSQASAEVSAESGSQAGAEANSQASAEASSQSTETSAESGSQTSAEASAESGSQVSTEASAESGSQASTEASVESGAQAQEVSSRQIQAAYVIKSGDTLAEICKRYYGSLDELTSLCEVNGITDANVIMPGQKIVLP